MEQLVNKIGASPYAVVVGLILSGIPIYVVLFKFAVTATKFVIGATKNGISRQISRAGKNNAKTAVRILHQDNLVIFLHNRLFRYIGISITMILYAVGVLFVFDAQYADTIPDPVFPVDKSVFFIFLVAFFVIFFMIDFIVHSMKIQSTIRIRRRILNRKRQRAMAGAK